MQRVIPLKLNSYGNIKEFILESSKALSTVEFNKVIQALLTGEYVEWYRKMISIIFF